MEYLNYVAIIITIYGGIKFLTHDFIIVKNIILKLYIVVKNKHKDKQRYKRRLEWFKNGYVSNKKTPYLRRNNLYSRTNHLVTQQ